MNFFRSPLFLRIRRQTTHYLALGLVLGGLCLLFGSLSERFLTVRTLTSIANQIPDLTLVAVGMTFVLVVRGIDLSVGSLLALGSAVFGVLMVGHGWPLWAAAPGAIAACGLAGALSGAAIVGGRMPSFIVTLGMLEIARGATYLLTDSRTVYIGSSIEFIGAPAWGWGVSPAFVLAIVTVAVGQFVLTRTLFGRYCVAIGTNPEAVRMAGIDPRPITFAVFVLSGLLCGLGGIVQASRLSSADPNTAVGLELSAIAAAVIGGTSLLGGRGNVINTLMGVLIIAVLQTGLAQIGASDPGKRVITGIVIVAAVLIDAWRQRRWAPAG